MTGVLSLFAATACVLYLIWVMFHLYEVILCRLSRRIWRKRHPYDEIDPKIKPLIEAMNATGAIKTVASCQGHFDRRNPYISFKSALSVAAYLERIFREDSASDKRKFFLSWKIEPCFDQNYELSYVIRLETCDVNNRLETCNMNDLIDRFIILIIRRKALDADLATMEHIIKNPSFQAVFADACVE